ncbi:hypothetical protein [Gardnerella vaginalis]|nr:hypothetical protein [Gardnerella vaginalis]
MGEERGYSRSGGKSFSGRGKFGGHRRGAKSGGAERHGGFHKDGLRRDGFHKGSFKRDGERNDRNERRDFDSNDTRRDGARKSFNKSGFKRDGFKRDGFHKGSFKRDGERNDRRFNHRFDSNDESRFERSDAYRSQNSGSVKSGNPRYKKSDNNRFNGNDERYDNRKSSRDGFNNGDFRKDGVKRNGFHKDGFHKDGFKNHGERRLENRDSNRASHSENRYNRYDKRVEDRNFNYENGPRRNSDGTISYPSQNPYTARRPGEPKMPKGMEWAMLSKESRERLRGLSKEHAENIGLHILAAYALEEEEPKLALEHAKWAAKQASRIDFSRETLAFIAYRQGDYKLAAREFRTAMRMNGYLDYLPFIADCERGIGNLDKALEICMSDEAKSVVGEVKAELFLVYAGVLADTNHIDKAIELVHVMGRSKGLPGEYRMRAIQAEQYFLEEAGRSDEALELEGLLDRLEEQYADIEDDEVNPEDIVIDYDLEHFNESLLEDIGVSKDDAKFAPEDSEDSYDSYDSEDSEDSDDSESLDDSSFEESKSDSLAESENSEKDNNKLSSSDNVETTSNGTVDSKE